MAIPSLMSSFSPSPLNNSSEDLFMNSTEELFMDPVTFEPMFDPVIARCGHTFDRCTIEKLKDNAHSHLIECPLDRGIINTDELVTNYLAKQAMDKARENDAKFYLEKANRHLEAISRKDDANAEIVNAVVTALRKDLEARDEKIVKLSEKITDLSEELKSLALKNSNLEILNQNLKTSNQNLEIHKQNLETQNQKLDHQNKELNDTKNMLLNHNNSISKKCDAAIAETKKSDQKLKNLEEMGVGDKFLVAFGPFIGKGNHLKTVMNRPISEQNKK